MFWNKKEQKESLPDLPPFKTGFAIPNEINEKEEDSEESPEILERHALPSFPDSPIERGFSQTAIKTALEEPEEEHRKESEESHGKGEPSFKTLEMDSSEESLPEPPKISRKSSEFQDSSKPSVFIKLEKFSSARKALFSAQVKIKDIESLLKKIRETKLREDQELSSWEKEVSTTKEKLEEISRNLFETAE